MADDDRPIAGRHPDMAETVERQQHEYRIALLLAVTILLSYAPVLYAHFVLSDEGISKNDPMVFIVLPVLTYCLMLAALATIWICSSRSPLFSIQWIARRKRSDVIGGAGLTIGVLVAELILKAGLERLHISTSHGALAFTLKASVLLSAIYYLIGVLAAPFVEELFWRGYVQGSLQRLFGSFTAVVVQAVLFVLLHLRGFGATILLLPFGLTAGIWRNRRGTLLPLIMAHAILNGLWGLRSWYEDEEIRGIKVTRNYGASVEELCMPLGAIADDNARLAYERAAALLAERPKELTNADLTTWPADLPDAKVRILRDWLEANEKALAEFEAGAKCRYYCPSYGEPVDSDPMLGPLGTFAFGTIARAQVRAVDHDMAGCKADVLTCYCLGAHLQGPKPLIDQLVGFAVKTLTAESTLKIMAKGPVDSAFLTGLQSELEAIYRERPAPISFKAERLISYDLVQRTFTDDGGGKGHIPRGSLRSIADPPPALRRLGISPEGDSKTWKKLERKQTMELIDSVYTKLDSIAPRTPAEMHQVVGNLEEYLNKLTAENPFVSACTPSFARAYVLAYHSQADEDALVVVTSLLRYRLEVGDLPDNLNALVDKGYLKELPADPFSGSAFVYKKAGGDFLLYSLGPDFDDDGGRPIRHGDDFQDGDIVFWPVAQMAY
jgi:membrane protease YdiL (CAAX protease family)